MSNLAIWAIIFVVGVFVGALVPPVTKWAIKQWRQIQAKKALAKKEWDELSQKWEDRK